MCVGFRRHVAMELSYLLQLGFSEKEAQVYITLFKRGALAISTLAKITGLKRTSLYDIVNGLLQKKYVIPIKQGMHTFYAVDDIQKIVLDQKDKITLAESFVALLKENAVSTDGLQVNYYRGKEAYNEMYDDILRQRPAEILGTMNMDDFLSAIDPLHEEQWTSARVKNKINARLILQSTQLAKAMKKEDKKLLREIKLITDKQFFFNANCLMYSEYITYFSAQGGIVGIRIHHPEFYRMQKQLFEMVWSLLP